MRALKAIKNVTQKARLLLAVLLLLGTQAFAPVSLLIPSASAAASTSLNQWANKAPASWQNGNLNENNSIYREGESVPFRAILTGLSNGSHNLDIQYDNVDSSKHAYDYLTSFDRNYAPDPCSGSGVANCTAGTAGTIPTDPTLSPVVQAAGQIKIYGANITSVSYLSTPGHSLASAKQTSLRITFSTSQSGVVVAWGGHIAKESDWGVGTGASAVSGSPYHQRILAFDGSGGNQDRSLKASAVILLPRLTITKVVQSGTALPSDFTFTVNPAINGTSVYSIPQGQSSVTISDIPTDGNYTITESGPNGYGFVSGSGTNCTFSTSTATATVAKGTSGEVKNASCTFTNGQLPSSITIVKDAIPNSLQDFSFTASGSGISNFMLDDDNGVVGATSTLSNSKTFSNLAPGAYTFTEGAISGWDFDNISCSQGASVQKNGAAVTITLAAGQNVTCTYTNRQRGTITVHKVTVPANNQTGFSITASGTGNIAGNATRTLSTAQDVVYDVAQGTYAVNEDLSNTPGWAQTNSTCSNLVINSSNLSASCTITNAKLAKLKIVKDAQPDSAQDFSFTATGTGVNDFTLDDDTDAALSNNIQFSNLAPGSFTFTEGTLKGWSLANVTCTGTQNFTKDLNNKKLSVTLAYGDDVTCTFVNQEVLPVLTLVKIVSNLNGGTKEAKDFVLKVNGGTVTNGLPNVLQPGNYVASEVNLPGYTAGDWTGDCDASGNVILELGDIKTCTITNYDQPGTLIIKKVVINDNGGTKEAKDFSFSVNGSSAINFESDGQNEYTVDAGTYSIAETTPAGYTVSYDNCSQVVIGNGQTKICTITNDDQPGTLIVKKVVKNDNGGTKNADDFSFSVNGGSATAFEADGRNDLTVNAGTYNVTEPAYSGYATSYDNCEDVVIPNGGTATCTITNDDIAAQLTVIKHVINNNGGTKDADDFTMNVTGTNVSDTSFPGDENGTTVTLNAGSYSVDEDAVYSYAKSLSANCSGTIALGESKICTITNDDIQPKLTITKVVINDNGGTKQISDFPLFVNITNVISGEQNGFDAGAYTISETQAIGYSASISGDCDANGNVTLNIGDVKSCTITNDDVAPKLKLVKYVANDNGGNAVVADFPLFINGNLVISGTKNTLTASVLYTATETNLPGYAAGDWEGDCDANGTITLLPGDDKTCTITNDDVAPTLTLIKKVINDNGGTAGVDDFGLSIGGASVNSGETKTVSANTPIALNEAGLAGYQFVSITGDAKCPVILGGTVTLNEGENITCTITNDDISPTLKLIKHVINNNGGLLSVFDFLLYVGTTNVTSGASNLFDAGAYLVSELNKPGYTASGWTGDCDTSGNVVLQLGQEYTCEITNDDQPAKIKVTKVVINDNGGEAEADDFTLKVNDMTVVSGETNEFDGNTSYTIGEDDMPHGYVQTGLTCVDTTAEATIANPFVAELGHNYECTVTNNDVAPKLTITKRTLPAESEQAFNFTSEQLEGFSLVDGQSVAFDGLQAGNYDVTEEATVGWRLINVTCEGGKYATEDNILLVGLSIGDEVTCEFTNEQLNTIQGHKFNDINGNHEWDEDEPALAGWTITLTKECVVEEEAALFLQNILEDDNLAEECEPTKTSTVTDATGAYSFEGLEPGTYTVCEVQKAIWTQTYPQTEDGCYEITIEGPGEVITADFGNKAKPQVLDEKTTELVNTGSAAAISTTLGLVILTILGALHLSTRRKRYQA